MSRELYIVCPSGPGAPRPWKLLTDGEPMGFHDTAVMLCRNRWKLLGKKSELQVHGKDGQIKVKNTYGEDPRSTKG